ncbi:MAG: hypothetical protein NTX64_13080, partial [Elusimicrobia bacterium]|nr:hypothetical protein [Elusimicrobiota bacterium]
MTPEAAQGDRAPGRGDRAPGRGDRAPGRGDRAPGPGLRALDVVRSADGALKASLALTGGARVESVLLRPSPARWTACLSTQAGCALACPFCATGLMGLSRDLSADEITGQVVFWRATLKESGLGCGPHNL